MKKNNNPQAHLYILIWRDFDLVHEKKKKQDAEQIRNSDRSLADTELCAIPKCFSNRSIFFYVPSLSPGSLASCLRPVLAALALTSHGGIAPGHR
ncbi:hypothetical protein D623_10005605 [Myotis brandtii]|uniref:Uncharacterized protein n=1 Tax=Myotis brandtii TaxID=109478 RepID=S7NU25_MYOBR|nr:hypothetical protein D623_10005605 [Myotis brandtii]